MAQGGLSRGAFLRGACAAGALLLAGPALAQRAGGLRILVVDRAKLLENTAAARRLLAAEAALREAGQARSARVKSELEVEERTLTDARAAMPPEEFARRSFAFDQRVKLERRQAQERGEAVVQFLENARRTLLNRLPEVLEDLRIDRGAALIVDASFAGAYDADLDVTADAVALFDVHVGEISFEPPVFLLQR